jgi:UDP-N-acetylglucosamine 4,6-dehydratase
MSLLVITGGTGSLGKAIISKQDLLKAYGVTKIRVLSRDEQKQVALTRAYSGEVQLDCYLADVSDKERMVFGLKDADYVIHAAAQKHIDKFELDVKTGYKTNIIGAQNVGDAFLLSKNAKRGIFVSTDKAAAPVTAYGVSKLAAEHLWLWHNSFQKEVKFLVARYGNIFGSRGSVIETWTEKAKKKEAFPLTDTRCTRFFMMIQEAADFVVKSLFESDRTLNIPPMKSAAMVDVAQAIWRYFHPSLTKPSLAVTGLRGVEKLNEVLEAEGLSSFDAEKFTAVELKTMYREWVKSDEH